MFEQIITAISRSFLQRMLHIHDIYRLKNLNYKEDIEAAVKK